MDEIKVNSFNEETLNEVSGGMHYGIIEGSVFYKGVLCYKYRILSGDTLSSIAQHFGFGTDYMYLAKFNELPNPDEIYENQIIYIPQRKKVF